MPYNLDYESSPASNPPALIIVASLFIACGAIGILWMICSRLLGSGLVLDIGSPLVLVFGFGLMRRIRACYDMAIVVLWIFLIFLPLSALFVLSHWSTITILGTALKPSALTVTLSLIIEITIFILALWQYRVLRRPEVRSLFKD
jgi:hypothetical protein